jgi:cytochrome c553
MNTNLASNGTGSAASRLGQALRLTLALSTMAALATLTTLTLGLTDSGTAHADSGRKLRGPLNPTYVAECAACHVAYPAGLLPAESWQRLMGGLDKHFGNNASVDAAAHKEIGTWLAQNAGPSGQAAPPQDRITLSRWFVREHDEISAATWKRPSIKSASNCAACHGNTEQGRYSEHDVKIPQ